MVDSLEIKLDLLTQAIKGLYKQLPTSQNEINNALTSLSKHLVIVSILSRMIEHSPQSGA